MTEASTPTVRVGTRLPPLEVGVEAEKMKTTAALLADPNPIHFDVRSVRELGLGERPVNQGPLNMGYVMNMLAAFSGSHERLRRFRARFLASVLAGDRVRATGVVTGLRTVDGERLADCDIQLAIVGGTAVLQGTATVALSADGTSTDFDEESSIDDRHRD